MISEHATFPVNFTFMEILTVAAGAEKLAEEARSLGAEGVEGRALVVEKKAMEKLHRILWPATAYAMVKV